MVRCCGLWLWGLLCLALVGCSLPQMRVDPELSRHSEAHTVSGRDGWWIEQRLSFGPYRAGPVSRGWTKGYDYPFIVRFTGAREKLRFAVQDSGGNSAMVHCIGKLREADLRAFSEYFDVGVYARDTFTGTISLDARSIDFFVNNLNVQQNAGYRPLEGTAFTGQQPISLSAVWELESGQRWPGTEPIGVEFLRGGEVIGAVETVNEGRVWIREQLDAQDRLVLASLASALLLRSGLGDHNDEQ